ncbi:TraR/DksA family transcriptional regulator [Phaeodactylibacter xiamenensis]|jgi:RNA polymerase-binding transcription factor DksA|uniref:TraR/DksA family transcriptional regulator n=1 Tax=Phaeodactylibacter xiamenensis TaxID=1524460 RepID=UPI0024A99C0B|nr:TraR/DksA C4-type zinc finger protein [Phaeodactylibacter xiamenensis]
MANTVVRYSDAELEEFKVLIESKLEKAQIQLSSLQEQILEIAENSGDDHGVDWMDDSSTGSDVEMLNNMAIRQRRYIQDLQNALIRIRNKVYGICTVTGELIDKKRLRAVPTTTKSLAAKTQPPVSTRPLSTPEDDEDEEPKRKTPKPPKNKVITRVIRKSTAAKPVRPVDLDDEDDFDVDGVYDDDIDVDDIDSDMISLEGMQDDDDTDVDEQDLRLQDDEEDED